MDKISLTCFVDFVVRAGTPKLTVVRTFKEQEQEQYAPWVDFYKKLREGIVKLHVDNKPKAELSKLLVGLNDTKKEAAYPPLVKGYQKFLGRKLVAWVAPPKATWSTGGIAVTINPELGLAIGGTNQVLKLYFKDQKLTKNRADLITHLMADALGRTAAAGTEFGVLDVRHGNLFSTLAPTPALRPLLTGEAASFAAMYNAL